MKRSSGPRARPSSSRSRAALSGASMEFPSITVGDAWGERDVRHDDVAQSLQVAGAQRRHQLAGRLTAVVGMRHRAPSPAFVPGGDGSQPVRRGRRSRPPRVRPSRRPGTPCARSLHRAGSRRSWCRDRGRPARRQQPAQTSARGTAPRSVRRRPTRRPRCTPDRRDGQRRAPPPGQPGRGCPTSPRRHRHRSPPGRTLVRPWCLFPLVSRISQTRSATRSMSARHEVRQSGSSIIAPNGEGSPPLTRWDALPPAPRKDPRPSV